MRIAAWFTHRRRHEHGYGCRRILHVEVPVRDESGADVLPVPLVQRRIADVRRAFKLDVRCCRREGEHEQAHQSGADAMSANLNRSCLARLIGT